MTLAALTAAPKCARKVWCDHSNLYLEVPHTNGGPPYIMKLSRDSIGLAKALEILLDAHNAVAPKGGYYQIAAHPKTKIVGASNQTAREILKKLGMI